MQIVLVHEGASREVDVDVSSPAACVADLLAAAGLERGEVVVDGRRAGPDLALDEVGLYQGAMVTVAPPGERVAGDGATWAGPMLAVTDGPWAGAGYPLRGQQVVGRDPGADLVLADPTVSQRHAALSLEPDGTLRVSDLGSENGTWIDGVAIRGPSVLAPGALLRLGAAHLRLRPELPVDRPRTAASRGAARQGPDRLAPADGGLIGFNRPPRSALPAEQPPLTAPSAPRPAGRGRGLNVIAVVAPLVLGALLVWRFRDPRFALFLLLSPVMALGGWWSARRAERREGRTSQRAFRQALEVFAGRLDDAAAAEVRRRDLLLPDLAETRRRALQPSTLLWQRRPDDADALRLRAGLGDVVWDPPLAEQREEPAPEVRAVVEARRRLPRCPVAIDLSGGGVVGLVGDRTAALALARSLVVQAAVQHGPADLGLVVCTTEPAAWDWVKWLPHVRGADGPTLAGDLAAAEQLGARLLDAPEPRTRLLVLDGASLLQGRRAPVRSLLSGASGPVCGIVLAAGADQLPAVTTTVVELRGDLGDADLRRPQAGATVERLVIAGLSEPDAREVARTLARYEDPELAVTGAGLPSQVRLPPLLGDDPPDPRRVLARWRAAGPDPAPATPIGVGEDGVVVVDLVRDGPHGLIGGTTGSGKSELLRTLVAGLAARLDPDHLVFVLIDYKGGSAFDACARLPHTVGLVTDLDEHLGERALRSLEAELAARERVLRGAGASDLAAYLRGGAPLGPLPRLAVVIDEFATVAAELPDFLGALVGVAQRGRSLGVHLLLATQRPSGAVNANIKANTDLRVALRVTDAQDSLDIVDRPDAAAISRSAPGRAHLRRGHGDVSLVQTARATAVAPDPAAPVRVTDFTFDPAAAGPPRAEEGTPDLELLVDAVVEAFASSGLAPPRRPWLPMLPDRVDLAALPPADPGAIPVALADDADGQAQPAWAWHPDEGSLAVFGAVGSGTTTALLTVARALAERAAPDRCHLYALDHGGGGLAPLAAFPHTGAVVAAADGEGQRRLLRLLGRELDRRRALVPAERAREPRIVVLVDGIGAFLTDHDDLDGSDTLDAFRRVFTEGVAVGIVFAVTAQRPGALPVRLGALVGQRLLLRLADPSEFAAAGLRPRQLPAFVPGRGVALPSRLVVQIAHPGADLAAVAATLRARWPAATRPPAPIGALPSSLPYPEVPSGTGVRGAAVTLVLGVRDDDLAPAVLALQPGDHALIAGPARCGKTAALRLIAALVRAADPGAVLVGVCEPRSPLFAGAALDAAGPLDELAGVIALAERNPDRLWVVLVDDCPRVEDRDGVLAAALRAGRPGVHVIGAGRGDDLRAAYGHWSRALRQSRNGLLLQPDLATDGDLLGVRLPRRVGLPLVPGRGFLVGGGTASLVQIAEPPPLLASH